MRSDHCFLHSKLCIQYSHLLMMKKQEISCTKRLSDSNPNIYVCLKFFCSTYIYIYIYITLKFTRVSKRLCNISVHASLWCLYQVTKVIQVTTVSSIMVIGSLTHCALHHSLFDLKAAQMNMQLCLIWECMLYEFKLDHKTMEATKKICCAKIKVQLITV